MTLDTQKLRDIAQHQKVVLFCLLGGLLVSLIATVQVFVVPHEPLTAMNLAFIAISAVGMVYTFKLSMSLYDRGTGIGLAVLTVIPLLGYAIYLVVNRKATVTLRAAGIRVGLMGARSEDIPPLTSTS